MSFRDLPADFGRRTRRRFRARSVALVLLSLVACLFGRPQHAIAIEEAAAAQGPPFKIHVFVSSRSDVCYNTGDVAAIKHLSQIERNRINLRGGVSGRPIELIFHDDARDPQKAIANVRAALAEPKTLAMIGLTSANRGKAVFETLGSDILKSGIPFISDVSVNTLFAAFPNVYTTRASQDTDSVPVIARFTQHFNFARTAFVGLKEAVGSTALGDGLRTTLPEGLMVADMRIAGDAEKVSPADITAIANEMKDKRPDLLYLYIGGANIPALMTELVAGGITPALFIGGRIESLPTEVTAAYPNAIYSLGWDRPPEVFNDTLRSMISPSAANAWMFEGAKIPAAPGWANGECKSRPDSEASDPFNSANIRAIGVGSQFADMVALVAAPARTAERSTDVVRLRSEVLNRLRTAYAAGRGAFKGTFDTWSFVPATRSAARDPFIIILPQGLGRTQLASIQFMRTKDGGLGQIHTLYADIDLIKAHRIDENEKSFFAEFYLSIRDNPGASIDRLEFSNAYLDASGGGRQVSVETIHPGGKSAAYPDSMKIYKVSGRFLFRPELSNYPFDTQRFSIDLQPKSGQAPFIIQPPPLELRDKRVVTDGWEPQAQYVGYSEEFVPVVDAYTHAPSVVPFYQTRFTWLMQREATDYFLRVAVPLAFILFVAYLSIFIPRNHFEAIVTIQVTALLSSVALYLSLPKIDSGAATLSDSAFVFAYLVLSIMIGISILRINPRVGGRNGAEHTLEFLHIVALPAFVALAAYYVYGLSMAVR